MVISVLMDFCVSRLLVTVGFLSVLGLKILEMPGRMSLFAPPLGNKALLDFHHPETFQISVAARIAPKMAHVLGVRAST
jgi:hypothetical protein